MATGRYVSRDLKELLNKLGYGKTQKGKIYDAYIEFDDEGYIKEEVASAEGVKGKVLKKLFEDGILLSNKESNPQVVIYKFKNWLNFQSSRYRRFKKSQIKVHWHDDSNRDDVVIEMEKRKELDKINKENAKNINKN